MPPLALRLLPFLSWRDRVTRETVRADLLAGLIGALVVLPQGVAYATLAGMPPQYGLYCAMLPAVVAATVGLGQMVLNASNFLRTDVVIMGIVVIGAVAYLFDLLMRYVERLVVPWKGKA